MVKSKRLTLLLSLVLITGLIAGCSSSNKNTTDTKQNTTETKQNSPTSQPQGTLKVALQAEPTTLNPYTFGSNQDRQVFLQIFNSLMEYDPKTFEVLPGIIKKVDISQDGLMYTLNLQEGVTFHNGKKMTGEDVKTSIEKSMAPDAPRTNGLLKSIKEIKVNNDTQLTVLLNNPDSLLLDSFVEVYVTPNDPAVNLKQAPVGTGPFKFISWNRNEKIIVKKSENYWKKGLPKLDGVEFLTVPDGEVKILQLLNGQVDFVDTVPTNKLEQIKANSNLAVANLPLSAATGNHLLLLNNSKAPFNNVKFRQAINYAIDRDKIEKALFGNFTNRTTAIPEGYEFYNKDNTKYYPRDLNKAKDLLKQSGYDGKVLEYVYNNSDSSLKIVAQIVEQSLKEIGINISSKEMEVAQWIDKVYTKKEFDLASTLNVPKPNPVDMLNHPFGKQNGAAIQWENKQWLDKLLKASSLPPSEYKKSLMDLQKELQDATSSIIIGGFVSTPGYSKKVEGYIASPQSKFYFESVTKKQ